MKETELAQVVVDWLKNQQWTVYQEVQLEFGGHRADVVGECGGLTWVVECKTTMSLALLEQALKWKPYANFVSVAVPRPKRRTNGQGAAQVFLRQNGIGLINVCNYKLRGIGMYDVAARLIEPNHLNRNVAGSLRASLCDEQKDYAQAGNSDGLYWTPFKRTCQELRRIVQATPGIHLKAAIDGIRHHYSSDQTARACISKYVQSGKDIIPGVSCERDGNKLCLYPQEAAE